MTNAQHEEISTVDLEQVNGGWFSFNAWGSWGAPQPTYYYAPAPYVSAPVYYAPAAPVVYYY